MTFQILHRVLTLGLCLGALGSTASAQTAPDLKGQKLTASDFGGALQKSFREGWAQPFEKATGAKVTFDSPVNYSKIKAQVESGNVTWDVAQADASFIQKNCGVLFEKIDTKKVAAAGIDARFLTNECGIPSPVGSYVFAYNSEKFAVSPPTSWADFFDLKKFPGKRAIYNSVLTGILEIALLADGVPAASLYPLDIDRALRKLDSIKANITWTQSTGALTEAFVNNQVDLALSFSGRTYTAAKSGAKVAVVYPQQIYFWDNWAVLKGSKNKTAAEAYLQYIAEPAQQGRLTELSAYGNANTKVSPSVDPLVAEFLPSNPKVKPTAIYQDIAWWAQNYDSANQRFVAWQSK
ncbi:ABC transporter substrate-binding protein [Variovorax paradoxus]|jgi:putative spermidine/putrescine transport system substrate-binding protein|uniref:ABC transporter substrate-binding protein n=1 Tax=Variovorax paradoxus TaxID=34073 RepID=UPI000403FA0C